MADANMETFGISDRGTIAVTFGCANGLKLRNSCISRRAREPIRLPASRQLARGPRTLALAPRTGSDRTRAQRRWRPRTRRVAIFRARGPRRAQSSGALRTRPRRGDKTPERESCLE